MVRKGIFDINGKVLTNTDEGLMDKEHPVEEKYLGGEGIGKR